MTSGTALLATTDWWVFGATIFTAIGEFAIVWAILSEIRSEREARFLEKVFDSIYYASRSELYSKFLDQSPAISRAPKRQELWAHSIRFNDLIAKDAGLRDKCDAQITHLNQLAHIFGKRRFYQRHQELIEWFPHAVVSSWLILGAYIFQRKKQVGHYWAEALINYALACVDYLLNDPDAQLSLFSRTQLPDGTADNTADVIIDIAVLKGVQNELRELCKAKTRAKVKLVLKRITAGTES